MKYQLIFDKVILKQLKKAGKTKKIRDILSKMIDRIELLGPQTGKLLDAKLRLYEMKNEKPSIRLYYKPYNGKVLLFEFEMKKSENRQELLIR